MNLDKKAQVHSHGMMSKSHSDLIKQATDNAIHRKYDFSQFEKSNINTHPFKTFSDYENEIRNETNDTTTNNNDVNVSTSKNDNDDSATNQNNEFHEKNDKRIKPAQSLKVNPIQIYDMSDYRRNEFIKKQLHIKISAFDPSATKCIPHFLEYDLPILIAALNDDSVLLDLVHKLYVQLDYRKDLTEEEKQRIPFWYNKNNLVGKKSKGKAKDEIEDDEEDLSVEISNKLATMSNETAKLAYLGTRLFPRIRELYPQQTNKLYNTTIINN